jgi:glycosyltransferase involved in cell wall biosynthesis
MSEIRISFVLPALLRGGAEGQLLELLRGLDSARFVTELVTLQSASESQADPPAGRLLSLDLPVGMGARQALQRGPAFLRSVTALASHYRRSRPHIVHAFLPAAALVGMLAATLARVPVRIVSRRSLRNLYRSGWISGIADRIALHCAHAITTNCSAITAELITADGVAPQNCFTICNGVDTARFDPSADLALRRQLGFGEDDLVIGTVANFRHCKRHVDLVRACARLRPQYPRMRLLMIGKDLGALAEVRGEIDQHQLGSHTVIVPGTTEPQRFYRALDIYVCASSTEGMSNSILEAMACAKPVVATHTGGNPELVAEGETGLLVAPCSPRQLAEALNRLAGNARLRREYGDRARETVVRNFSLRRMVSAHEWLYAEMLRRTAARLSSPAQRYSDDRVQTLPAETLPPPASCRPD